MWFEFLLHKLQIGEKMPTKGEAQLQSTLGLLDVGNDLKDAVSIVEQLIKSVERMEGVKGAPTVIVKLEKLEKNLDRCVATLTTGRPS